ncbi:FixJ family two-component response regulator [Pseudomonas brassicacearum]|uniref:FixJ family two-component response regulator n=1 Tax=Pseudomonas brassicacearum TaxID=930166 RepID=A0AAW8M7G5_9PSED|nr:response regulator [Pseudomonas brassicacearum]MDR6957645.1 FixJ family two-component response regulator [Pseudomonas brassicacearum]
MTQNIQKRTTTTIAVVDDDESVRAALDSLLRSSGYSVRTYRSALEFLGANATAETHCLISDIQMPGMSGIELHERLSAMGLRIPTLFITAYPGLGADTPGLVACLPKPCEADELLSCIETALRQRH